MSLRVSGLPILIGGVGDSNVLQVLNNGAHRFLMSSRLRVLLGLKFSNIKLSGVQQLLEGVDDHLCILLSPEVEVKRMYSVFGVASISRVITGQPPFVGISARTRAWGGIGGSSSIDHKSHEGGKAVRIDDSAFVEEAIEGVLVCCACIVGDFYPAGLPGRVVVDVEIRGFIEAM